MTIYVSHMTNASLTDSLAAIVRTLMVNQDISINNLADRTGIAFSTLRRRLNGKTPFTTNELEAVATELDTTIVALLAMVKSGGGVAA